MTNGLPRVGAVPLVAGMLTPSAHAGMVVTKPSEQQLHALKRGVGAVLRAHTTVVRAAVAHKRTVATEHEDVVVDTPEALEGVLLRRLERHLGWRVHPRSGWRLGKRSAVYAPALLRPAVGQPPGYKDEILAAGVLSALGDLGLPTRIWVNQTKGTASLAVEIEVAVQQALGRKPRRSKVVGDVSDVERARSGSKRRLMAGKKLLGG